MLQPKKVRQSLEQIFSSLSNDFSKGKMGCAQETLQDILSYLHREYLFPNYLEEYLLMNADHKFKINNELDDTGCSPKCASHQTFGLDFCEITECTKCKVAEDVSQLKREVVHQLYVEEILNTQKEYKIGNAFTQIISVIIKGEADFHLQYKEKELCKNCNTPVKTQKKWLLELPNIYTFGLQHGSMGLDEQGKLTYPEVSKEDL